VAARGLRHVHALPGNTLVDLPRGVGHQVLGASFLVERERVALFDDAMNELAQEQAERMHFKYLGPLAPHSFVGLTAEAR